MAITASSWVRIEAHVVGSAPSAPPMSSGRRLHPISRRAASRKRTRSFYSRPQSAQSPRPRRHLVILGESPRRERCNWTGLSGAAVERLSRLAVPTFEAAFTPCVEVGWRLSYESWGRGYAVEGARAACEFGFRQLGLDEIVSFTVPANARSRRVMDRLGMRHDPRDDFDHPRVPSGHSLKRHLLYRLPASDFMPMPERAQRSDRSF